MKLKFERYPGLSCLFVRGEIEPGKFKILLVGIDSLLRDQEEPIIIHMGFANMSLQEGQVLAGYKKKLVGRKFPIYWISPDRAVGEYKSLELLSQRLFFNPKVKNIGLKIKLDDEVYLMTYEIQKIQEEITKLGGTDESVQKIILENDILKAQKLAADGTLSHQMGRMPFQSLIQSDDPELAQKTKEGLEELHRLAGGPVDL